MENFSFELFNNLRECDQKQYIIKYFIPLTNGKHLFYNNNKYELIRIGVLKHVYFKRFGKRLSDFYFKEYTGVKDINEFVLN